MDSIKAGRYEAHAFKREHGIEDIDSFISELWAVARDDSTQPVTKVDSRTGDGTPDIIVVWESFDDWEARTLPDG